MGDMHGFFASQKGISYRRAPLRLYQQPLRTYFAYDFAAIGSAVNAWVVGIMQALCWLAVASVMFSGIIIYFIVVHVTPVVFAGIAAPFFGGKGRY